MCAPGDLFNALDNWRAESSITKFFLQTPAAKIRFSQIRFPQKLAASNILERLIENKDSG